MPITSNGFSVYPASDYSFTTPSVLPLTLSSFFASLQNNVTHLSWQTEQEINTSYFSVEYSNNATEYKSIAIINASGNSNSLKNYSANHTINIEPNHYYRLKMIDKDGKFTYS
ncbi:MAG: hypothetical protein ACOVO1_03370 [Chitinophagaceae bacterium]